MVIKDGATMVAQYGQWDGYPSGQGKTALKFLLNIHWEHFFEKLSRCRFIDDSKQEEIDSFFKSIGVTDGWMNMQQAAQFKGAYPQLSRDNGANILNYINDSNEHVIWLRDESDFVNDSLMNEWTYVIDFDKRTFEVYSGFNKSPLNKDERFYSATPDQRGYYPVRLVKSFPLNELPTEKEFLKLEHLEEVE